MAYKILVVDDEVEFLEFFKMRLESEGYEVVTANDGRAALEKAASEKPDALVVDILMPEVDGISVLKKVRETDKRLPVFIITAFSNEERFKIANQYNASGFIIKTSELKDEIKKITETIKIAEKFKGKKA